MEAVIVKQSSKAFILAEKGEKVLLKNMDTSTNNVLLGDQEIFDNSPSSLSYSTLRPLGTIVTDGSKIVYGLLPLGNSTPVRVERMEAVQSTPAPSDEALQIASSGLALDTSVHLVNTTLGVPAQTTDITTMAGGKSLSNINTTLGVPAQTVDVNNLHATGKTIAVEVSQTGTPLLRLNNAIGSNTNQTVSAASTATVQATTAISTPAVQLYFALQFPAAVGALPFAQIIVNWFNTALGVQISSRVFVGAGGSGAKITYNLLLPCRGDQIQIRLANLDPAQTLTYDWSLTGITHFVVDDDFQQTNQQTINGFTNANQNMAANILFNSTPTINPNSSITRIVPSTCRRCYICVNNAGGNLNNLGIQISDFATSVYSTAASSTFYGHAALSAGTFTNEEFQVPYGPALMTLSNLQPTNTITPIITITTEAIDA